MHTEEDADEEIDWIALLRFAFVDERVAPDILVYKADIMASVEDLVSQQTEKIAEMETNADLELERIIYEREMQRTKWLIKAYHRTRIQKLEQHVQYYLHHEQYTARLSPAELEYAKRYFTLIGRHATQMILNQLPDGYQSFVKASPQSQTEDMVPAPDFKHNTLMKAAYQSVDISPSEDDPSHMTVYQGDIILIQYHLIKDLVLAEEVRLL